MKKIRWIGLLFSLWLLALWGCGTIPIDVILQSINIMGRELVLYKCRQYDVLIEPPVGDVGLTDFSQKKRLMEAGMQAARQALPKIRKLVEERS